MGKEPSTAEQADKVKISIIDVVDKRLSDLPPNFPDPAGIPGSDSRGYGIRTVAAHLPGGDLGGMWIGSGDNERRGHSSPNPLQGSLSAQ